MKKSFFLLLAFSLLLTACGSGKGETEEFSDNRLAADDVALQFYSDTAYPLPGGYTIAGISRLDSCLLLAGNGDEGAVLGFADYSMTDAGRVTLSETRLVDLDNPEAAVYGTAAGGDGNFYVLTGVCEGDDHNEKDFSLLCYSREGNFLESVPVSCGPDAIVTGLQVGDGGEIVLYGFTKGESGSVSFVSLFSAQGEPIHAELLDSRYILSSALCAEGIIFSGMTARTESFYSLLDIESGKLTDLDFTGT